MTWWKPVLLILALAALAVVGTWYVGNAGWRTPQETVVVTQREVIRAVYATGTIEPVHGTALAPEKTGRLAKIVRNEGQSVAAGDVVAEMDSRLVQERLHEAEEQLAFASKELARHRTLLKAGAVSHSQADTAERDYGESRERVHAIRQELQDLKLISPVNGVVLRRAVEEGQTLPAGAPAFWVGSLRPLRVTAEVDEEDIGKIQLGQTALIKADAFPTQVFEGTVAEITPQGDPVNKVFRIRIALPDDTPLMINMTVEVNVVTDRIANALVIPNESESGGFVWRLLDGKLHRQPVTVGERNESQLQVLQGLSAGDVILKTAPSPKK